MLSFWYTALLSGWGWPRSLSTDLQTAQIRDILYFNEIETQAYSVAAHNWGNKFTVLFLARSSAKSSRSTPPFSSQLVVSKAPIPVSRKCTTFVHKLKLVVLVRSIGYYGKVHNTAPGMTAVFSTVCWPWNSIKPGTWLNLARWK